MPIARKPGGGLHGRRAVLTVRMPGRHHRSISPTFQAAGLHGLRHPVAWEIPFAMPIRALIVGDEPDARENLQLMLEEHCPEVDIVGQAGSAGRRERIASDRPQALFLDIKMPGEDGFQLLRSLGRLGTAGRSPPPDEYALQAFRRTRSTTSRSPSTRTTCSAPWARRRLLGEPDELAEQGRRGGPGERPRLSSQLPRGRARSGWPPIVEAGRDPLPRGKRQLHHHPPDRRQAPGEQQVRHIRAFETNLDPGASIAYKSYIVNLEHLTGFSRSEGNMAVLDTGAMVPVSRRRLPEFLATINTF